MKRLISLALLLLMVVFITACTSTPKAESIESESETEDSNVLYLPQVYIVDDTLVIPKEKISPEVDYEFYLGSVAITMAKRDHIENGVYIAKINEYKFYVYLNDGEFIKLLPEKIEE